MVAKLQSLSRTSSTRCGSFKWRRELWKLKPSMAQYWFYTEDPSTDDRLLIYFPATSSPLEYCKKNICQYAPIMISWSVAIKNASVRAYCKVIGECPVIVRMYKMLRSFDWQKYKNSWPNLVDWEKSTKKGSAVTLWSSVINTNWWVQLIKQAITVTWHRESIKPP